MDSITSCTHSIVIDEKGKFIIEDGNVICQDNATGELVSVVVDNNFKAIFGFKVYEQILLQTTQPVQSSKNDQPTKLWTRNAILRLINLYKGYENEIKSTTIKNEAVFKKIAADLHREGFTFSGTQCRDKFKYLKLKYMKKKDNMKSKSSGEETIHFEYFDEMEDIFGSKPTVNPVAIASSSRGSISEVSDSDKENNELLEPASKKIKPESQKDAIERRHRERLERQDKAIEVFDRFVNVVEKLVNK